jgi:hypothetical protein
VARFRHLAIALILCCTQGRAQDDACSDTQRVRKEFFQRPWAALTLPGEERREVRLGALCVFSEHELLEYFVSSEAQVPTISSRATAASRDPHDRYRLFRTWQFPELEIQGEVAQDGTICPDFILLRSDAVPLICGLRVGADISEFRVRLGELQGTERFSRYEVDPEYGHAVQINSDPDGKVTAVVWYIPRGH